MKYCMSFILSQRRALFIHTIHRISSVTVNLRATLFLCIYPLIYSGMLSGHRTEQAPYVIAEESVWVIFSERHWLDVSRSISNHFRLKKARRHPGFTTLQHYQYSASSFQKPWWSEMAYTASWDAPTNRDPHHTHTHTSACTDTHACTQTGTHTHRPRTMIYGKEAKTIIAFLLLLFFQG